MCVLPRPVPPCINKGLYASPGFSATAFAAWYENSLEEPTTKESKVNLGLMGEPALSNEPPASSSIFLRYSSRSFATTIEKSSTPWSTLTKASVILILSLELIWSAKSELSVH